MRIYLLNMRNVLFLLCLLHVSLYSIPDNGALGRAIKEFPRVNGLNTIPLSKQTVLETMGNMSYNGPTGERKLDEYPLTYPCFIVSKTLNELGRCPFIVKNSDPVVHKFDSLGELKEWLSNSHKQSGNKQKVFVLYEEKEVKDYMALLDPAIPVEKLSVYPILKGRQLKIIYKDDTKDTDKFIAIHRLGSKGNNFLKSFNSFALPMPITRIVIVNHFPDDDTIEFDIRSFNPSKLPDILDEYPSGSMNYPYLNLLRKLLDSK